MNVEISFQGVIHRGAHDLPSLIDVNPHLELDSFQSLAKLKGHILP